MHLPTIAALVSCVFFATTHALPTPGSTLDSRDTLAINVREGVSVAAIPPAWKREKSVPPAWKRREAASPPDWRRSADASPSPPNLARNAEAVPPDWKREVSTDEAASGSPDWKRDASYPNSPVWRRGQAEDYPTSPAWRRESSQ